MAARREAPRSSHSTVAKSSQSEVLARENRDDLISRWLTHEENSGLHNPDATKGTAIYADQLGWFGGSIDWHIWQSHGASG